MRSHDHPTAALDQVLEDSHLAIALLTGTLVASPVLLAALSGRQPVSTALGLYVAAIAGAWIVVGLLGGALSLAGRQPTGQAAGEEAAGEEATSPAPTSGAGPVDVPAGVAVDRATGEPDPATATR